MDKIAIIRSMTSPLSEHSLGAQYLMTGYKPTPALEYPTFGATVVYIRSQSSKNASGDTLTALPPNIAVPNFTREVSGPRRAWRCQGRFGINCLIQLS